MNELRAQRMPEKMCEDRQALDALLDSSVLAHIGLIVNGRAAVFPTAYAVHEGRLVIHGSTGSRWMRALSGQRAVVAVTKLDAMVIARSTFESSIQYRSAMVFGCFEQLSGEEKRVAIDALADRLIPARSSEVRASTKKELAATAVLAMPITEWSLRVSEDWPDDDEHDLAGDAWAGVVRFGAPSAEILPAPDLRADIPVPCSVQQLAADPGRFS